MCPKEYLLHYEIMAEEGAWEPDSYEWEWYDTYNEMMADILKMISMHGESFILHEAVRVIASEKLEISLPADRRSDVQKYFDERKRQSKLKSQGESL